MSSDNMSALGTYTRRPSPLPSVSVALGARSVVWRRFEPGEYEDRSVHPWVKLLWSVAGVGNVLMEGRMIELPPEYVAIFLPGMHQEAWCPADANEPWEVRWFTLDGPLCAEVARAFGLGRAGVWHAGPVSVDSFESLRQAIAASITPEGERHADVAAYTLLARIAQRTPPPPADLVVDRAIHLVKDNWRNPDFGVEQLAQAIGVHRSALSRRFSAQTGLPPSTYLTNLRMQHALSLLCATDLSVSDVAHRCGFADADYFSRLFRRIQGITPGAFRRDHSG